MNIERVVLSQTNEKMYKFTYPNFGNTKISTAIVKYDFNKRQWLLESLEYEVEKLLYKIKDLEFLSDVYEDIQDILSNLNKENK